MAGGDGEIELIEFTPGRLSGQSGEVQARSGILVADRRREEQTDATTHEGPDRRRGGRRRRSSAAPAYAVAGGADDDATDTPITGSGARPGHRPPPSSTPARAGSPRPRSATRRATTRSRSPSTTAPRSTSSSTSSSTWSATRPTTSRRTTTTDRCDRLAAVSDVAGRVHLGDGRVVDADRGRVAGQRLVRVGGGGRAPRSGDGNGFATRYAEDFALYAEHGLTHHRLSLEWNRLEPEQGQHAEAEVERYRAHAPGRARRRASRSGCASTTSRCPGWFADDLHGFRDDKQGRLRVEPARRLGGARPSATWSPAGSRSTSRPSTPSARTCSAPSRPATATATRPPTSSTRSTRPAPTPPASCARRPRPTATVEACCPIFTAEDTAASHRGRRAQLDEHLVGVVGRRRAARRLRLPRLLVLLRHRRARRRLDRSVAGRRHARPAGLRARGPRASPTCSTAWPADHPGPADPHQRGRHRHRRRPAAQRLRRGRPRHRARRHHRRRRPARASSGGPASTTTSGARASTCASASSTATATPSPPPRSPSAPPLG